MVKDEQAANITVKKKFGFSLFGKGRTSKFFDEKPKGEDEGEEVDDTATSKANDTESRNDDDIDETNAIECEYDDAPAQQQEKEEEEKSQRQSNIFFDNIGSKFLGIVKVGSNSSSSSSSSSCPNNKTLKESTSTQNHTIINEQALSDIVASVRSQIEQGSDSETKDSLPDIIKLINAYRGKMTEIAKKYFGSINLNKLSPSAVLYYIEKEDEVKNPSWKRRQHRYVPDVKIETIHELYDALQLAQLCYADTAEEIKVGLKQQSKTPFELVYVNVRSAPGQPANFVAVQQDQHSFRRSGGLINNKKEKVLSSTLRVIIGVRGTKTASDAITDLLCDTVEYNGGLAHSFILESGKYIAEKHRTLIEELRVKSGKSKVLVTLIGHSLGAGAASIAGMELHRYAQQHVQGDSVPVNNAKKSGSRRNKSLNPIMEVKVIGFGCPALVSENLAVEAKYITTVINDADVVPRMSGISVTNLLLDIMAFDWMEYVQRDIQFTLNELQLRHSRIFKETTRQNITQTIESLLQKHLNNTLLRDRPQPKMIPEVYPPGNCIHLYRDGCGITGCYVPNTFFSEIDISRRMIDDHLFHSGYEHSLLEIARQNEKDHHFRFDG